MFLAVYMDETVYAQTPLLIVLFSRPCYTICKVARPLPAVPFGLGFGSFFILYFGGECVNIKEIAQLAGVSVATISRVLNHPEQVLPETRERVLAIMEANDYTPNWFARGLNLGRTNTIALLLPNIQNCLYQRIFSGVETVARSKQYVVLSCHTHGDPALECDYLKTAQTRRIDGVILVATALDEERLQPFLHARVPCVHVGRTRIRALESQCYLDFEEGAYRLTQHMLELGHKAVGLLLDDPPSVEAQQVHSGCDQALLEAGCPPAAVCLGENSIQGGYLAAQKLFRGGQPPSTLITFSSEQAFGVLKAAQDAGLAIPEQMALACTTDSPMCSIVSPALTCVEHPAARLGMAAARMLFDSIENEEFGLGIPQKMILQPQLKIRRSCGNSKRIYELFD